MKKFNSRIVPMILVKYLDLNVFSFYSPNLSQGFWTKCQIKSGNSSPKFIRFTNYVNDEKKLFKIQFNFGFWTPLIVLPITKYNDDLLINYLMKTYSTIRLSEKTLEKLIIQKDASFCYILLLYLLYREKPESNNLHNVNMELNFIGHSEWRQRRLTHNTDAVEWKLDTNTRSHNTLIAEILCVGSWYQECSSFAFLFFSILATNSIWHTCKLPLSIEMEF